MRQQLFHLALWCVLCHLTSGRLLAILLDGLRWDYFDQGQELPGFQKVFQRGIRAKHLVPAFATVSYTNHYTLFTGRYTESHGFVANIFYDVATKKSYSPSFNLSRKESSFMYNEAEPLWVTAVKQNKKVYMYHYVNCDVPIKGRLPTFCLKYNGSLTSSDFRRSLDNSIQLFANSKADLSIVYYDSVDNLGHRYGPLTNQANAAVKEVDVEIDRMLTKITEAGLEDKINVMLFSDHGMRKVSPTRVVNVTEVIDMTLIEAMIGYDAFALIWPKQNKAYEVYNSLKTFNTNLDVYWKDEIPLRWHFKNHRRIPTILLTTKADWWLVTPVYGYYYYSDTGAQLGSHGFDNRDSDMHGIFAAFGKNIRRGQTVDSLENVNLYQMMCSFLEITPEPHNGSWLLVNDMISVSSVNSPTFSFIVHWLCLVVITFFLPA